jgi:beta-lactamase superfamily II metal-dependent hydrolase
MPELRVIFLDAGQGDSTLVVFPDNSLMLVDCGSIKNKDVVLPEVVEAVQEKVTANRNVIDYLIVTHPDEDHYNLIVPLLNALAPSPTVRHSYYGGSLRQYRNRKENNATHDWLFVNSEPRRCYFGLSDPWFTAGGASVYLIAANATGDPASRDRNANSIALLIEYAGTKVFLMGDATQLTEHMILRSGPPVRGRPDAVPPILARAHATALKMGHHGSDTSSIQSWIQALQPNYLFISSDKRAFGRRGSGIPTTEHLESVIGWSAPEPAGRHPYVAYDRTGGDFNVYDSRQCLFTTLKDLDEGISLHFVARDDGFIEIRATA